MLTSARSPSSPVPVPVPPTRPQRWSRPWAVYGFFGSLLLLGLGIYADYGISWDEDLSRATGMVNLRYLAEQVWPDLAIYHRDGTYPPLHEWVSRDYGALFETPAALIERLLHLEDAGDRYRLRHLLTFLVCFGGVVAVYKLGKQRFGDWRIGLLGAMWLVLSPRLFAESFYNSKDAVFTALFAIAMHTARCGWYSGRRCGGRSGTRWPAPPRLMFALWRFCCPWSRSACWRCAPGAAG